MNIPMTLCLYLSVFAIVIICARVSDHSRSPIGLIIGWLVLSALAGFRSYNVGVDTLPYLESIFYRFDTGSARWDMTSFADGYAIFTKAILSIFPNATFLLMMEALITNGLILLRFWDFRRQVSLSSMTYIYVMTAYLQTMCLTCQYLAIALVFYGTRFLEKKRPVIYLLIVLLAMQIHISALIGVVALGIYILAQKSYSLLQICMKIISIVLIVVCVILAVAYLQGAYSNYSGNTSSAGLMVFMQLGIFILYMYISQVWKYVPEYSRGTRELQNKRYFANLFSPVQVIILYGIGILLSAASYFISNAGRIALYYTLFSCVYFGLVIRDSLRNISLKKSSFEPLAIMVLFIWFIIYFIYVFVMHDSIGVLPYNFVSIESYIF